MFPGLQGGPHMNNVAGAAITFKKAAEPAFTDYAEQILTNAKALAAALMDEGVSLITGGTDNHLMVIDTVKSFGIDGRAAQEALDRIGITTNKQVIPDDPLPPVRPSRRAARHAGLHHPRHGRGRHAPHRRLDRRSAARAGRRGGDGEDEGRERGALPKLSGARDRLSITAFGAGALSRSQPVEIADPVSRNCMPTQISRKPKTRVIASSPPRPRNRTIEAATLSTR